MSHRGVVSNAFQRLTAFSDYLIHQIAGCSIRPASAAAGARAFCQQTSIGLALPGNQLQSAIRSATGPSFLRSVLRTQAATLNRCTLQVTNMLIRLLLLQLPSNVPYVHWAANFTNASLVADNNCVMAVAAASYDYWVGNASVAKEVQNASFYQPANSNDRKCAWSYSVIHCVRFASSYIWPAIVWLLHLPHQLHLLNILLLLAATGMAGCPPCAIRPTCPSASLPSRPTPARPPCPPRPRRPCPPRPPRRPPLPCAPQSRTRPSSAARPLTSASC
jgi:hypothetical protein